MGEVELCVWSRLSVANKVEGGITEVGRILTVWTCSSLRGSSSSRIHRMMLGMP